MVATQGNPLTRNNTHGVNWGRYALIALATVVAATIANLIVYYIGGAIVFYDPQFPVLATSGGTIFFTVIPALIAPLLYAPILRFARRPALTFTIIAAIILVISVMPDFTYIPTVPGSSPGQIAILVLMHIVAAVVITGMLTRFTARQAR